MHSYICTAAFHLGTIDVQREGCDVEAEPEDGARVDQSKRRKDRLECMLGLGWCQAGARLQAN